MLLSTRVSENWPYMHHADYPAGPGEAVGTGCVALPPPSSMLWPWSNQRSPVG